MVTSGGCCRTGEVEGVGTVELVCVGGLLRVGGESLLLPVWGSVGGGSMGKWSWMLGYSGQLPDGQETSMGWEQDGLGRGSIPPRVSGPVHLVDGYG